MRQIVLDTETTGLDPHTGHRIIEIGGIELVNRKWTGRTLHHYFNPQRAVDAGAVQVHGLTNTFLQDKPLFESVAEEIWQFMWGAELIIHNAPFDLGFLNAEFGRLLNQNVAYTLPFEEHFSVIDTLKVARSLHPGQRNSLDVLCKRYAVDNSKRNHHGALLDADLLAHVYLAMTGGQTALSFTESVDKPMHVQPVTYTMPTTPGIVISANEEELKAHHAWLQSFQEKHRVSALWQQVEEPSERE